MKTKVLKIDAYAFDMEKILEAAQVIRQGGLVIFPTETVYGIAADFNNPAAMQRLREVKQRPEGKPFAVLIYQKEIIANYTSLNDSKLYKLIHKYWPGPLTVVVPSQHSEHTIGIRIPNHRVALRLVEHAQCTIAAPSANFDGEKPPQTCEQALKDLEGLVDVAIDSGPVDIGTSSTVVNLTDLTPKVLREGALSSKEIMDTVNAKNVLFVCTGNSCRSVMAEYMFKDMLKGRQDVCVDSAGTSVFFAGGASHEAVSVLKEKGIDASQHVSQAVTPVLLKKSDLIFVMTKSHRHQILERVPEVENRVYLLREFSGEPRHVVANMDVPDPIGQGHHDYQECLKVIQDSLHKVKGLV